MVNDDFSFVNFTVGVPPILEARGWNTNIEAFKSWGFATTSDENFQKIRGLKTSAIFYDDLQVDNTKAPYVLDTRAIRGISYPEFMGVDDTPSQEEIDLVWNQIRPVGEPISLKGTEDNIRNPYLALMEAISQGYPLTVEKF